MLLRSAFPLSHRELSSICFDSSWAHSWRRRLAEPAGLRHRLAGTQTSWPAGLGGPKDWRRPGAEYLLEEGTGARLARRAEELRRGVLDDHPAIGEIDAIGDFAGEAHLGMGDEDAGGHALGREVARMVTSTSFSSGVERGGDSSSKSMHLRVHRQRAGDGDALLLAAGEFARG